MRESFRKVNENFQDLFSLVGGGGDKIKFENLDDGTAYAANQIIIGNELGTKLSAKSLTAGDGIRILNNPNEVVISLAVGLNSAAPSLAAGLNAKKFPIANVPLPSDLDIQEKIDGWNYAHQATGVIISVNDLLITKGYADTRYQIASGESPLTTRAMPSTTAEYVKHISGYTGGNVSITDHGFSSTGSDNGKAFVFNSTGTVLPSPLANNNTYYIRYVDSSTISLHTSKSNAIGNIGKINVSATGNGIETLRFIDFDPTLSGNWLTTEALPRSEVVRRAGDTMSGHLVLSGDPTLPMHPVTKQFVDALTTDNITEGLSNLYFTNQRASAAARQSLLVTQAGGNGQLSYDSTTGEFIYTGPSPAEIQSHFVANTASGFGNLVYDNGVFTYTGPSVIDIRSAFSAGAGISIENGQIVSTISQYGNASARQSISVESSGIGSVSYNSDSGVITYVGPTASEVRTQFSSGVGVTITDGAISIGQDIGTSASPVFDTVSANVVGNITGQVLTATQPNITTVGTLTELTTASNASIGGNLTVDGQLSTVSPVVTIGANVEDGLSRGVVYNWQTGGVDHRGFFGVTANNTLTFIPTATESAGVVSGDVGTIVANLEGAVTGNVTGQVSSISNFTTNHLSEGTANLYYTDERVISKVSSTITSGPNVTVAYDNALDTITISADSYVLSSNTTNDLPEGSRNFYYTDAKSRAAISVENLPGIIGQISYDMLNGVLTYAGPTPADVVGMFSAGNSIILTPGGTGITISVDENRFLMADFVDTLTTDQFAEGVSNQFFTVPRARGAISVVNSGTDLVLTYDATTGVITYHGESANTIRAHFSAGDSVSVNAGVISVISDQQPTANTIVKRTPQGGVTGVHISPAPIEFLLTANKTLTLAEITSNLLIVDMTSARTLTMPAAGEAAGYWLVIKNSNASFVLTITSLDNTEITTLAGGTRARLMCDGAEWFVL